MNIPENHLHKLIDGLTHSNACVALYRLPWKEQPVLVLQREGNPDTYARLQDLNGKTGFVLAPFHADNRQPIVLIRPDRVAKGWPEIKEALADWESASEAMTPPNNDTAYAKDSRRAYAEAFSRFITPLRQGIFQKLVLARSEDMDLPAGFSPLATFINACNNYPRMMISLVHTPVTGTWIGSTPEIILSEEQDRWHTVSLAGTMPVVNEGMPEEWGTKNREEQALVSTYLRETLQSIGADVREEGPYTARAGQVMHLKTDFYFHMDRTTHLGDVLHQLHPTPAVCGLPKQAAYDFILQNEGHNRSYYAGIIGWLNPDDGQTALYVNLRCMHLSDGKATLYAGGGILPSSVEELEWEETRHKMETIRKAVITTNRYLSCSQIKKASCNWPHS